MSEASSYPTEIRLGLEWELWVLEELVFERSSSTAIIETLCSQGVDHSMAVKAVNRIVGMDAFKRMHGRARRALLGEKLLKLQRELSPSEPQQVAVAEDIDRETLLADHWKKSVPIKLTQSAQSMRAVTNWSFDYLSEHFGGVEVEVNTDRTDKERAADTEVDSKRVSLREFAADATQTATNEFYIVSRNGLFSREELKPLWADLAPLPEILEPPEFPRGVSLWVGPGGTVTPPHYDPHNVLLVQIVGRKRIRLAPRITPEVVSKMDGYYLVPTLDEAFGESVQTVELGPGEALFVPAAWFHEVTALDPSMTLSFLSFPWPNHFHWLVS